jgi:DNA replication protein DnaD|tara:strand:+ start:494 stop:676 length:183 start_codon:yes stop_codon:yes gene_type:complete
MTKKIDEIKKELSDVTDKIESMIEKGVSETNPKLDKLSTKQHQLEIELDFETNVMGVTND